MHPVNVPDLRARELLTVHAALLADPPLSVSVGLISLHGRYLPPAATSMMALVREQLGGRAARRAP